MNPKTPEDEIREFKEILKKEDKKDTIEYIKNLEHKYGENKEVKYWKVYTDINLKDKTKPSLEILKELLEEDKENKTYLNIIGNIYLIEDNPKEALEYYQKVANQYKNPIKEEDFISSQTGLYESNRLIGNKKQAKKANTKLLKIFNNDKTKALEYANKQKMEKNYIEALKTYNTLLYNDKKNTMINLSKADLYTKRGDNKFAIKTYQKVLQEHPDNIGALTKEGISRVDNNEIEKAIENFNKVLKINSNSTEALYGIGYAKKKENKLDDALEYFNKTLEENPQHKQALLQKAEILENKKDYENAINSYNKILEKDKENIKVLKLKANLYKKTKKTHEELEIYNNILNIKPEDIDILKEKAKLQTKEKDYKEALETVEKILDIKPKNKETLKLKKKLEDKINNPSFMDKIKSRFR